MKIITGLDWLNFEILYPEKLIDFCLNNQPSHEGCNVVDTVYEGCSKQTNYKRKEIQNYLYEVINYKTPPFSIWWIFILFKQKSDLLLWFENNYWKKYARYTRNNPVYLGIIND